jgi:hypothetical protein
VDGRGDGIDKAAVGVGRVVHRDLRLRRDRARDLDVEHHFGIGAIRIADRLVVAAIDRDGSDGRNRNIEAVEVGGEVGRGVAAAELDDPDRFARAVELREGVKAGELWRIEGLHAAGTHTLGGSPTQAEVRPRLLA